MCDAAGRKRVRSLEGVDFPVIWATFSPDAHHILANGDSVAQCWDVATGKPVGARMRWVEHANPAWHTHRASIRNDGRVAVTGGFPIHMWAVPSGEPLGATSFLADTYYPAFTPDGSRLIVGGRVLDVAPGLLPTQRFAQGPRVGSLVLSPDGRTLEIQEQAGSELRNRFLDLRSGKQIGEPAPFHFVDDRPPLPVFSPDSGTVLLMSGDNVCELRDNRTGEPKGRAFRMDQVVRAAAFSADGRIVATGDRAGMIRLWDAQSGHPIGKPMVHRQPVWRLQFSRDGRKLLAAGGNIVGIKGEARLWDPATCEPLGPPLDILGTVQDAAISPDDRSVAIGAFQLSMWDAATSRLRWRDTRWDMWQVAFGPDSRRILAHSFSQPLAGVYDVQTGALQAGMKHQTGIRRSTIGPDGRLMLTSGEDLLVRLWDIATGLPLGPPRKALQRPPVATFDSDGQSILLADDAHISRWPLSDPIEGTRERVRLCVEVSTRLRLDEREELQGLAPTWSQDPDENGKRSLTDDPYVPTWNRLQERGGLVGNFRRSP